MLVWYQIYIIYHIVRRILDYVCEILAVYQNASSFTKKLVRYQLYISQSVSLTTKSRYEMLASLKNINWKLNVE